MLDLFQNTRNASQMDETLEIVANGINGNELNEESDDNENGNETVDDDDDEVVVLNERPDPPAKRIKLQVPEFLQKNPARDTWRPIETPKPNTKLGIASICPKICFFFLRDECVEGDKCYDSHILPSESDVSQALNACGTEKAAKLLHVIVARCPKVLHQFFPTFIEFFAQHNMKDDLIEAIAICERQQDKNRQFTFFQHLMKAFNQIGEQYTTAMETILMNLQYARSDVIDTLLNMNLVDGVGVSDFLCVFRSLNQQRYRFNHAIIDRLMYLCTQSENALSEEKLHEFLKLIFNILRNNKPAQRLLDKHCYDRYIELYHRTIKAR